jgi:hypothetical protein
MSIILNITGGCRMKLKDAIIEFSDSQTSGYEEYYLLGITPCGPLKVNGTYHLHLQGQRISRARYQPGLFFNPEDGGNMFLRNIS